MTDSLTVTPAESPRLNRRQAAKIRTRGKVMEAARLLFAERGYEPATIRDIAKGAGMSTGAVFANFQDKAELFDAILADDMARMAKVLRQGAEDDLKVKERLSGALNAGYHASVDELPLVQAVVARSWFQPLAAEMRSRKAIKALVLVISDVLSDGVRSGELRQDIDVRLISEMIWNAYLANYRHAAYDNLSMDDLAKRMDSQLGVILAGALAR